MLKKFRNERGLALIWVLLLIVIIAVLTPLAVVRVQDHAKIEAAKADLNQLRDALKGYMEKYGEYPGQDYDNLDSLVKVLKVLNDSSGKALTLPNGSNFKGFFYYESTPELYYQSYYLTFTVPVKGKHHLLGTPEGVIQRN